MAIIIGNTGNNTLVGTGTRDRISGLSGDDRLFGRADNDRLYGGDGRDTLRGGLGNDLVRGGTGNDALYGGAGCDVLVGGLGRDIMHGGAGADVFRFDDRDAGDATALLSDVIRDFSDDDVLDLVAMDLDGFYGYDPNPPEDTFSYWERNGNTYVTWNTAGGPRDIELTGYTGDVFSRIRWYDDDFLADQNTTGRIAAGEIRTGTIEVDVDEDWFRITLAQDQLYTIDLGGFDSGAGTLEDPYLVLLDADGNYVGDDDDGAGTFDARLQYYAQDAGTYYIGASGGFYTSGTYQLSVTAETLVDDVAGDVGTSGRIAAGETLTGEVDYLFDVDWFRITLAEGETYTIDLRGQDSGSGTLPDPLLVLFDEDGAYLDENDDAGSLDSQLVHTASTTGTYFIAAQELGSGTGTYELSVSAGSESDLLML